MLKVSDGRLAGIIFALLAVCGLAAWAYAPHNPAAPAAPEHAGMPTGAASTTLPLAPEGASQEYPYIEVANSCGPYYDGACVNVRSGPGTAYASVMKLRDGMVLKVAGTATDSAGAQWYKLDPGSDVRYPERITSDWYVRADLVHLFYDKGDEYDEPGTTPTTTKRIVVDRSKEMLYAYDGDTLFMEEPISTGLDDTPTPRGTFTVYKKTPSRYMQGPLPGISDQYYDLPGVPWNLYFTEQGAVVHGAYWHNHFGEPWSHGCVNLSPENAKKLYYWAEVGMTVTVED